MNEETIKIIIVLSIPLIAWIIFWVNKALREGREIKIWEFHIGARHQNPKEKEKEQTDDRPTQILRRGDLEKQILKNATKTEPQEEQEEEQNKDYYIRQLRSTKFIPDYDDTFEFRKQKNYGKVDIWSYPTCALYVWRGGMRNSWVFLKPTQSEPIDVGRNTIGDTTEEIFRDSAMSRHHFRIQLNSHNEIEIVDMNSANGTFVNGKQLTPHTPVPLKQSDLIVAGLSLLVYYTLDFPKVSRNEILNIISRIEIKDDISNK